MMNTMTVPLPSEPESAAGRPKAIKNRQISLYVNRLKPDIPPFPLAGALPTSSSTSDSLPSLPSLPALPISPRWDSLQNGAHVLQHSPPGMASPSPLNHVDSAAANDTPDLTNVIPEALPNPFSSSPADSSFPSFSDLRNSLSSRRLSAQTTQSSVYADSISASVENFNFSRPRKQSIKQPVSDDAKPVTSGFMPPDLAQEIAASIPQTPPWQRSRGPSVSSFKSTSTFASPPPPINTDVPRAGTIASQLGQPPTKPAFGLYNRVESSQSAPASATTSAPWVAGDEARSSFRSQLTTSTTPGTAATERSSVMTKDSSVSSVYANTDEPSLEDVMHMYEKGFADDTDDENSSISDGNPHSRPVTAMSDFSPVKRTVGIMADEDDVPPVPATHEPRNLDAQIRQSKLIFSSLDFISQIPAVSGVNDAMTPIKETEPSLKRDSGKSIASDPSASSDPSAISDSKSQETTASSHDQLNEPSSPMPPVSPLSDRDSTPAFETTPTPTPAAPATTGDSAPAFVMPPNPTVRMPTETEDPGARDRYGFKKESQFHTRQQYDEWNKGYSQYLARRRRKWMMYLKDSALMTDQPIRFPPPNSKTKRFVRKGIPPDWRGAAWFYYAGGPAILGKNSGLYVKLLQQQAKPIDVEAIERDLHRTFPDNIQFKFNVDEVNAKANTERHSQNVLTGTDRDPSEFGPRGNEGEPPIITSLRRVLHAFAIYNPKIGYCQSLNFLAGLLLLFVETEEHCFWLLNVITHIYLPGTHEMSLEGSKVDLSVLMAEIRDTMPEVWDKIGGELEAEIAPRIAPRKSIRRPQLLARHKTNPSLSTERLPPITLCMTAWFMSCYIGTLPIETTLRVWDVFFYEGSKTLFRIAMAVFKQGEPEIRSISDPMEVFGVVQSMPRKMLDANALMDQCFKRRNGFSHLNQDVIDGRRQERRDKARKERGEDSPESVPSGYATEGDGEGSLLRRKGTLFGRRKRTISRAKPTQV